MSCVLDFHLGFNSGARPDPLKKYNLYIHFRESENRWVIDDTVAYTGGVMYYSQDNRSLEQTKFEKRMITSPNTVNVKVKEIKVTNPRAYNSEAVSVEGFHAAIQGLGTVCSAHDDGIYIRLPPQEDINNQPHYYKESVDHPRHLYFVIRKDKNIVFWAIAKTCNAEVMGACAYTENRRVGEINCFTTSNYKYYPQNQIEQDLKIKVVRPEDDVAALVNSLVVKGTAPANGTTSAATNNVSVSSTSSMQVVEASDQALPESYHAARCEQAELHVELTRWKDSNHECVFFNNDTGIVSFLSLDKQVLQNNMHPVLLKHLESNHINVGEDLRDMSDGATDRYWEILAATTGVTHSKEDAARVSYNIIVIIAL
jgi:hypothetical protein